MQSTAELITLTGPKSRTTALPGTPLTSRERFLRAALCEPVDHPPIWMMRQAGRALPEYRKLKENFTFLELVRNPHLATEVTLQPIRRFAFDAAILFSDILVIPEAMGQGYFFREGGGVEMEFPIRTAEDIARLNSTEIRERLAYVPAALRMIRRELGDSRALLGFTGSPWTLANFMLDGGSSQNHTRALELLRTEPELFRGLMAKLTAAITEYLSMQIAAGVDAIQIFDTHGGLLPSALFRAGSGVWMENIVQALRHTVPVIVFSKGTRNWSDLTQIRADVFGIDHGISLAEATTQVPETFALQGNLDPELLLTTPERAAAATRSLVAQMDGRNGWIFNLGHGLPPSANLECISAVIDTLRN